MASRTPRARAAGVLAGGQGLVLLSCVRSAATEAGYLAVLVSLLATLAILGGWRLWFVASWACRAVTAAVVSVGIGGELLRATAGLPGQASPGWSFGPATLSALFGVLALLALGLDIRRFRPDAPERSPYAL
jgi:hypothetical protein